MDSAFSGQGEKVFPAYAFFFPYARIKSPFNGMFSQQTLVLYKIDERDAVFYPHTALYL